MQVKPVVGGHVGHPGVLETAVVENHVHHHLESFAMRLVDELPVFVVGAESGIHSVVVGGSIAVIGVVPGAWWRVVLEHWGEPQRRHAQVGEVVKMLSDALQVAAVAVTGHLAVAQLAAHPLHLVVGGVAVGKAVGHEHIEHIGIGKALFASVVARLKFKGHGLFLLVELEVEVHGAGLHSVQTHADDEVVGTLQLCNAVDGHAWIVGGDGGGSNALAIDHDLELVVFEPCKPVFRLHPVDIEFRSLQCYRNYC